jgi:predicted DNA-binding transcriptional regulator AlpA
MNHPQSLRPKAAAQFLGVCESTLWVLAKRPDFPPRMKLSPRVTVFDRDALAQFRDAQAVSRPTTAANSTTRSEQRAA